MTPVAVANAALGAAFGRVFSLLYEAITDVINKTSMYESILQRLKDMLDSMRPLVEKMLLSNRELDLPEERTKRLIKRMEKGEKRVRKYSKLPWWKYLVRFDYANKLLELEKDLGRFFKVDLSAWNAMNTLDIREQLGLTRLNRFASFTVPRFQGFVIGLDVPLKVLKMQLLKVEVSMLVLTAPGGCGKTTLAKMLGDDKEIKGKFKENIFFVRVSKTPNLKVIIEKLLGKDDPGFQSDEDAIGQLEHMLRIEVDQNKSILLILDDVWSGSESLLEKFAFGLPNYKILVTSRNAFPSLGTEITSGCCKYKLKPLNDDDAMELFRHSAGLQDGSSSYIPDGEMVKKIVKGCGGFPLALKVVGKSLSGKRAAAWLLRVAKWSDGCSIFDTDIESELLERLQSSLDFKDREMMLRECFMDLGSFPEDQKIPVGALIDMWSELYELVADGIHAIANLYEIDTLNLASLVVTRQDASEVGSYYSEDFVLQHDLLRELAIHQSSQEPLEQRKRVIIDISGNNIPKWWTEQRQQPINAQLLSISTGEKFSSIWCNILPAKVEVLVLNFQAENNGLPEFLEKMDKLKVLIVTNYGFFPAELGNVQLLGSLPNLKRIRLQKVSIPSIFKILPQLRNLEKISLFMCNIGQNFRDCSIEISNAWSNLMEINIDYCKDLLEIPTCLCYIVSLKKLSVTNCHKLFALPIEIRELTSLEVLRLRSCTNLSELPESITSLQNLRILDISDCQSISKLPKHIGELGNLNELHMTGCLRLRNPLLPSTKIFEKLKLVICDEERAKLWEPIQEVRMDGTRIEIRIAKKDINLNWLANRFRE